MLAAAMLYRRNSKLWPRIFMQVSCLPGVEDSCGPGNITSFALVIGVVWLE